ncbi:restriction endonuclease subunit S [candidate division KSB1 bacterium]|nr:restriction endonuclease subunit S [candidate division KSB1 bacterium]
MTDLVKIGDVSNYRKEFFEIADSEEYKRCRVQLHKKGVVLRDIVKGNDIKTKQQRLCKKNDFIVAEMDAKFGGYGIIPETLDGAIVSSHYYLFELKEEKILPEFLKVLIDTDIIQLQIKAKGSTNYSRISPKEVMEFEIPCPSIEFQQQVVKKYSNSKIDIIKFLNEANYQLNLFKQLRQAILQEAVEGKLTAEWRKQNPELISGENRATRLLEQIKAEKERLVNEGKISRLKVLPPISENEKLFNLPESWIYCRIGEITYSIVPNRDKPSTFTGSIPWITISNVDDNSLSLDYNTEFGLSIDEIKRYNARVMPKGSVLTGCVGRYGIAAIIEKDIVANQQLHCYVPICDLHPKYIAIVLKSQRSYFENCAIQTTLKYVNKTKMETMILPLPSLAEQQTISEKVDRLMANIDALEEQVKSRKEQAAQLMQAVLREAFNGA